MSEEVRWEDVAYSVKGVPIRLMDELWKHIVGEHPELSAYREDCLDVIEVI